MQSTANLTHRPITDSPWYWTYLFCTGGLIALVIVGPKYAQRQTQIEQNGQKRQWAAQLAAGEPHEDPPVSRGAQSIVLWPLFVVLGLVLSAAWIKLIRDHLQRRARVAVATCPVDATAHEGDRPAPDGAAAQGGRS